MFSQLDAIVLSTQAYLTEAHVLLCPFLLLFTLSCRHVQARQEVREQYYSFTICTVCCVSSVYRCVARAGAASSACLTLIVTSVSVTTCVTVSALYYFAVVCNIVHQHSGAALCACLILVVTSVSVSVFDAIVHSTLLCSSVHHCAPPTGAASSACLTLRVSVFTMSVFDVFVHMAPAVAVLGVLNQLTDTC
jgi:hypothetical protein